MTGPLLLPLPPRVEPQLKVIIIRRKIFFLCFLIVFLLSLCCFFFFLLVLFCCSLILLSVIIGCSFSCRFSFPPHYYGLSHLLVVTWSSRKLNATDMESAFPPLIYFWMIDSHRVPAFSRPKPY